MGDVGPCGPCTEIHYYKGEKVRPDLSEIIEVWNLVFMEFYDSPEGQRKPLPMPCVDTGMGLERLCSILQNKKSNYHTDLFRDILISLEKSSGLKYDFEEKEQTKQQKAFRITADHSRAISFLILDGVVTGNDKESYVLRRLIRRALYYSQKLDPRKNLLKVGVNQVIFLMSPVYPALLKEKEYIESVIDQETRIFFNSLKRGRKKLDEIMSSLSEKFIPADAIWNLYSTYGFPLDLTRLIAQEKGWVVPEENEIKKQEKTTKKTLCLKKTSPAKQDFSHLITQLRLRNSKETFFTGYKTRREEGCILFINPESQIQKEKKEIPLSLEVNQTAWIVTDKTCFYPEGGGPVGDQGVLKTQTGQAEVLDCQKKSGFVFHKIKVLNGLLKENQICKMEVNPYHRQEIAASHTATHLLHSALRSVLGKSVKQAGSLIEPGRLRFDFTYPKALTKKQLDQIEKIIHQNLVKKESLSSEWKDLEKAKQEGTLFLQGENYGPEVRVISIGENTSRELCGGIHVQNTMDIQQFKIVSEKGIQSGIRRIMAYTRSLSRAWESFLINKNLELREYLQFPKIKNPTAPSPSVEKENPFLQWLEDKNKKIKNLRKRLMRLQKEGLSNSLPRKRNFITQHCHFNPLALQVLEFGESLNWPLPKSDRVIDFLLKKDEEKACFFSKNSSLNFENKLEIHPKVKNNHHKPEQYFKEIKPLLKFIKIKDQEADALQMSLREIIRLGLTKEKLVSNAKTFTLSGVEGKVLIVSFPIEDRKILSDISESLLSGISSGLVILCGKGGTKHPVLINRTKNFTNILSANEIFKDTIAPLCEGQGGGKPSFAQGSITNKSAFLTLEKKLLKKWSANFKKSNSEALNF